MTKKKNRTIISIHQSPMNSRQFLVALTCGHAIWITRSRRPQIGVKVKEPCGDCLKEAWDSEC